MDTVNVLCTCELFAIAKLLVVYVFTYSTSHVTLVQRESYGSTCHQCQRGCSWHL